MAKDDSSGGDRLLSFFDADETIAGEKLLRMRQKLIRYFAANRCPDPQDHADETIFRVIKALNEGKQVDTAIEAYIQGFAKFVLLEVKRLRQFAPLDEITPDKEPHTDPKEQENLAPWERKENLACEQKCFAEEFSDDERKLLIGYYTSEHEEKLKEAREKLAEHLGLTRPVLKKRAFRFRERLEACMKNCLDPDGTKLKKPHL
jgi:DNA-directed RNA polymerase specialized sigma24 family protein